MLIYTWRALALICHRERAERLKASCSSRPWWRRGAAGSAIARARDVLPGLWRSHRAL